MCADLVKPFHQVFFPGAAGPEFGSRAPPARHSPMGAIETGERFGPPGLPNHAGWLPGTGRFQSANPLEGKADFQGSSGPVSLDRRRSAGRWSYGVSAAQTEGPGFHPALHNQVTRTTYLPVSHATNPFSDAAPQTYAFTSHRNFTALLHRPLRANLGSL